MAIFGGRKTALLRQVENCLNPPASVVLFFDPKIAQKWPKKKTPFFGVIFGHLLVIFGPTCLSSAVFRPILDPKNDPQIFGVCKIGHFY